MELADFLVEAKQRTWANERPNIISLENGGKRLVYKKGIWRYEDTYYGNDSIIGQELVFKEGKPYWGMNYCGTGSEKVFPFLKKALRQVTREAPFRGPAPLLIERPLTYMNKLRGNIEAFSGEETILEYALVEHALNYHGGLIKN
jgi:hypothetical protein